MQANIILNDKEGVNEIGDSRTFSHFAYGINSAICC